MSERETALTTALRMLRNECHAIRAMSYDAIKDTAGYTNLKVWISRIEEADTLLAKAAGADPVPVCQWTRRGVYVEQRLAHSAQPHKGCGGPMSAPHDPWKDARQWAEQGLRNARVIASTKTGQERIGWLEDVQYWQSLVDALVSQAETIRQGAAEIATLRAQNADYVEQHGKVTRCLAARTVERDALRSTVDQQQVRITALEAALERIAAMDFDANEDGRRNLYSGAARFVSAWLIARQALETP